MSELPDDLRQRLREAGEQRIVADWPALSEPDRALLTDLIRRLNFEQLKHFYAGGERKGQVPPREQIRPAPVLAAGENAEAARAAGEAALRAGEVAVVMVAGGRGTRLGFHHAKGMFPIGPVSHRSLFQIHAEKILALRRRFDCMLPWLIMTSDVTDEETREYFERHHHFGLEGDVHFFRQSRLPVFDVQTGRPIREQGRLLTSPNGHGGTLLALDAEGWLRRWQSEGRPKLIFYFQVDNPLVKIADPVFLGQHLLAAAEVSTKIVRKPKPTDPLGNVVYVEDRCCIVEYSDLTHDQAHWTDTSGRHLFSAGNTGIHCVSVAFLRQFAERGFSLPLHLARKKVKVDGHEHAAVQFEMFIFDILPAAQASLVVETDHGEEFVPLKNKEGPDSPAIVRKALHSLYAGWLKCSGVTVPEDWPIEISPLAALGPEDLKLDENVGIRVERVQEYR
jgi:UDP-N-acetylglucosamine/UDP-N-acetylgalactosamine diphosphorylase